jgi:hypothetical protein
LCAHTPARGPDRVINVRHASILEQAGKEAGVDVTKIIVPGAGHNDVLFVGPEPKRAILDFLGEAYE